MYFFFSGEGPTDLGTSKDQLGPLALIIDQIHEDGKKYPFLVYDQTVFVRSEDLERIKPSLRTPRRSLGLRGLKTPPEMRGHRKDAHALIYASAEQMKGKPDKEFVAVLFRDYNRDKNTDWQGKRKAMTYGFQDGFNDLDGTINAQGVSAVASPVSEAWWLSAIYRKEDNNKNCKYLESTSHGNGTDHALKNELETKLGTTPNRTVLNEMVDNREIDYTLIDSDSFLVFRRDFETAIGLGYLHHT